MGIVKNYNGIVLAPLIRGFTLMGSHFEQASPRHRMSMTPRDYSLDVTTFLHILLFDWRREDFVGHNFADLALKN